MKFGRFIVGGAILSIIVGFVLSQTVVADAPKAGSSADPVVSKSYVDKAIEDKIKELENKVVELTVQAEALQSTVNALQDKLNRTTGTTGGTKNNTGTTTPSTPNTGTGASGSGSGSSSPSGGTNTSGSGQSTATSVVGKKCYAKSSVVNTRKGPSTDEAVVRKVTPSDAMTILEVKNDWYRVAFDDNTTAWVASWVVEVK